MINFNRLKGAGLSEDEKKENQKSENNDTELKQEDIEANLEQEVEENQEAELISAEEEKIIKLQEEIANLNDRLLRNEAEYQNIKKRMEREKARAIEYAYEGFASDMLNVIDSLENGAKSFDIHDGENDELYRKVKEGFNLTLEQFQKVFEKHGISPIDETQFNPNVHNAIMQVESEEHKEGELVKVFQKGYKIKDRVLRAAMVSVAK